MDEPDEAQTQQLQAYYTRHTQNHYDIIGRYLLGMATDSEVTALMKDNKAICEVAYYLGLRAQSQGDYLTASHWYRVAIETGLINNGEYRWAYDQLYLWYSEGKFKNNAKLN
jgi:lipoprotein NlpI